jgi:hypothetical protein
MATAKKKVVKKDPHAIPDYSVSEVHERKIVATLYRGRAKKQIWVRYYKHLKSAAPRAIAIAIERNARPGDVIQFTHILTGFVYGEAKIKVDRYEIIKSKGVDW